MTIDERLVQIRISRGTAPQIRQISFMGLGWDIKVFIQNQVVKEGLNFLDTVIMHQKVLFIVIK